MKNRNIVLSLILTVFTFGIYGIYWMAVVNNDANKLADSDFQTDGFVVILLTFITLGFYSIYWAYKQGENYDIIRRKPNSDGNILFLVFQIFGIGIAIVILLQLEINRALENKFDF